MAKPTTAVEVEESTSLLRQNKGGRCAEDDGGHYNDDPTFTHGDVMDMKEEDVCCIISSNINGYAKTD